MLATLSIRDFVLIEKLDLDFAHTGGLGAQHRAAERHDRARRSTRLRQLVVTKAGFRTD